MPDLANVDETRQQLILRGAVLIRLSRLSSDEVFARDRDGVRASHREPLCVELAAALHEKTPNPVRALWDLLRADGILAPLALLGAMSIAAGAVIIQMLLFRGLFDIAWALNLASQRLGAVIALMAFLAVLMLIEVPIAMESMRLGRHLETRLRMAELATGRVRQFSVLAVLLAGVTGADVLA